MPPSIPTHLASDMQKSALISQIISAHESDDNGTKIPPTHQLRQLQEELERMLSSATSRVAQLEQGQRDLRQNIFSLPAKTMAVGLDRAGSDTPLVTTETPNPDKPASKRIKLDTSSTEGSSQVYGSENNSTSKTSNTIVNSNGNDSSSETYLNGSAKRKRDDSINLPEAPPLKARHSSGTPVQEDFSRVKVTNQVQIQSFWASLEPYFRNISDDDISYLGSKVDKPESYTTPKLGKFYAHKWAEEEVSHYPDHLHNNKTRHAAKQLTSGKHQNPHGLIPRKSFSGVDLLDSDLSINDARLAPLTERIISALVSEQIVTNGKDNSDSDEDDDNASMNSSQSLLTNGDGNLTSMEDRLKRELRYIGILDEDDVNWNDRKDDEVCVTIRALQRQLREQTKVNQMRKERMLAIAKEHIGYQEYTQVIDELDKQVEQSYLKRNRLSKSRKRKSTPIKTVALSDNALNSMDRRRRVIQAIGHIFPSEKFDLPTQAAFKGLPPNPDLDMK